MARRILPILLALSLLALPAQAIEFTLFKSGTATIGPGAYDVKMSDLNRDGFADAVVAVYDARVIAVVPGSAAGFGEKTLYGAGHAVAVDLGDFDGNGSIDLLEGDWGENAIRLWQNQGDGAFLPSPPHSVAGPVRDLASGDFDNNGTRDAVVATGTGKLVFLPGLPGGDFGAPASATVSGALKGIAVGDLDLDGDSDLVVVDPESNRLFRYRNDGLAPFPFVLDSQVTFNGHPSDVALSDFDGDAVLDAAVSLENGFVAVVRGGSELPPVTFAIGTLSQSVQVGDFDQEGGPDLLVSNYNQSTVSVLLNLGGLQFGGTVSVACGKGPRNAAAGDVDGDGDTDIVTGDFEAGTATLFLSRTGPGQLVYMPGTLDFGFDYTGNEAVLPIQLTNVGNASLTVTPGAIEGDQFEYAGTADPIVIGVGGSSSLAIRYLRAVDGLATGSVHLTTDDPHLPEVTIPLVGHAGPPAHAELSIPPAVKLLAGTTKEAQVVVRNSGGSPLHLTVPAFVGDLAESPAYDLGPTQDDFVRFDAGGGAWNLDWEGRVISGERGEYFGGLDESNFLVQTGGTLGLGGRELRLGPVAVAPGILVTRKIHVPQSGAWARFIDVAYNPNENARVATFDLIDNIGYVVTAPIRTSDGDAQFELSDDWIVAPAPSDRRTVGRVFRTLGAANVPVVATWFATTSAPGSYSRTRFVTTLGPHDRACVIQWAVQGEGVDATSEIVESLRRDPGPGLVDADAIDRGSAWNLVQAPRPFRLDGGSYTVAPGDSAVIAVVFGAEAATHDADLAGILRIGTDDPDQRTLQVPLAFSILMGPVVDASGPAAVSSLALSGLRPNPMRLSGAGRVSFQLATSEPATLTLFDVRGRIVATKSIPSPSPGPGSIVLSGTSLAPGIVWMRLEQGGRTATAKGILLP